MTISHRQGALSWGRKIGVAAGTAAAAATVPLLTIATADADVTTDLLGSGADAIAAASIPDLGSLAEADFSILAAPTTVPEAIAASLVPITTASGDIDTALMAPGISSYFDGLLTGQGQVLDAQTDLVNVIGDIQQGFTGVDVADLVKLDDLLTVANTNVLDATTDLIGTAGDPVSAQMSAALDLITADFGALGTDFQVAGVGATADLLSMFGIDPSFLFDGLAAGI